LTASFIEPAMILLRLVLRLVCRPVAAMVVPSLVAQTPPSITNQPASQSVPTGSNVTFTVTATGTPPLQYQWRLNGVNFTGATNDTLVITNAQIANAGAYTVVVANTEGLVVSDPATLSFSDLATGPPASDNFVDRFSLFDTNGAVAVNNTGATKEPGEPDHAGKPGGRSVWYTWQAPSNGIATFGTRGSTFDTLLGVYTGSNVSTLTAVASSEDDGGFLTSSARFNAQAGIDYQMAIDGFAAASGDFILSWNLQPTAELLPVIITQPVGRSVTNGGQWTLSVTVANGGPFQYQWVLNGVPIPGATNAVFVATNVQAANVGDCRVLVTNAFGQSIVSASAFLEIGQVTNVQSLDKLEDVFPPPAPLTPEPAGGTALPGVAASTAASTGGALLVSAGTISSQTLNTTDSATQPGEPSHCGVIGGASRWFALTPETNGLMLLDTLGSDIDTVLAVYTGGGFTNFALVACDNNGAPDGVRSAVAFVAAAGTTYLVAVDGVNAARGVVRLNYKFGAPLSISGSFVFAGDGGFQLEWEGAPGESYVLQASMDLSPHPQGWESIATNVAGPTGRLLFIDSAATNLPGRYYRVFKP
jgi:hypothetical protein